MAHSNPTLSIIVPVFNECDGIAVFLEAVTAALKPFKKTWEVVFIDDGSSDGTAELISEIHRTNRRIKLVRLSRNFGKEAALTAGLKFAKGKAVVPMDVDLQDPPEVLLELIAKWQEGYQVVQATRRTRRGDSWFKRSSARLFYKILHAASPVKIPQDTGDFRLLDRQVVDSLNRLPEKTRFMKGLFSWVGFNTATVWYDRPERAVGQSRLSFIKLWKLALDGIFSFSTVPLKMWTYLGGFISLSAFCYAAYLIVRTLLFGVDVPGYSSIMTAILFMGGVQLVSLGVIGEYVARIYRETKGRPLFIVQEMVGLDDSASVID